MLKGFQWSASLFEMVRKFEKLTASIVVITWYVEEGGCQLHPAGKIETAAVP